MESTESLVRAGLGYVVLSGGMYGTLSLFRLSSFVFRLKGQRFRATKSPGVAVDPHLDVFSRGDDVGAAHDLVELILGHADLDLAGLAKCEWGAVAPCQSYNYGSLKKTADLVGHATPREFRRHSTMLAMRHRPGKEKPS